MSQATKRKHVTQQLLESYDLPSEDQEIVRVIGGRGNNLHEVETANGDRYLVSMPRQFRKNVWMKRGCYVVVEPIEEGNKVKAEIVNILMKDHMKYIQEEGKWPAGFMEKEIPKSDSDENESSDELTANPNHPVIVQESDDDSSDESEDDDESPGDSGEEPDDERDTPQELMQPN